jgi:hypothetical protein
MQLVLLQSVFGKGCLSFILSAGITNLFIVTCEMRQFGKGPQRLWWLVVTTMCRRRESWHYFHAVHPTNALTDGVSIWGLTVHFLRVLLNPAHATSPGHQCLPTFLPPPHTCDLLFHCLIFSLSIFALDRGHQVGAEKQKTIQLGGDAAAEQKRAFVQPGRPPACRTERLPLLTGVWI